MAVKMEERGRFYVVTRQTMTLAYWPFSRITAVSRYRNVSTLHFIGAKDDGGGDNWSYIIFRVIAGKKNIWLTLSWTWCIN